MTRLLSSLVRLLTLAGLLSCAPSTKESSSAWNSPVPTDSAPAETGPPTTDTDCAGVDADADGVDACTDCDDADPDVFPGAPERCNGEDDDCDGVPHSEELDADGDAVLDCWLCDEAGYWRWVQDQEGEALGDSLNSLTGPISCLYSSATDFLFLELDKEGGEVECVYTGTRVEVGEDKPDESVMNTEHSWPQSQGADAEPAKCDLHHLFPTLSDANQARASYPFGEVAGSSSWSDGGSSLGSDASGATVFEPRDAHKGDVARAMLYFSVRYGHPLDEAEQALYTGWHLADPPDSAELERTFAIRDEQGHANPFATCPELVERL